MKPKITNNCAMNTIGFGKHKGKSYDYILNIDPQYFLWLWNNCNGNLDKKLRLYIEENMDVIKDKVNDIIQRSINNYNMWEDYK